MHKKERTTRYPWFRLYSETLSDRKIAHLCRVTGQPKAVIVGMWVTILALANDSPVRGALLLTESVPLTSEDLAIEMGMDHSTVAEILAEFERLSMVTLNDGVYHVTNWHKRQFSSDSSTERVKKSRAEQRKDDEKSQVALAANDGTGNHSGDGDDAVTPMKRYNDVTVTPPDADADADPETKAAAAARPSNARPNAFALYERACGMLSPLVADQLKDLIDEFETHRSGLPRGTPGFDVDGDGWLGAAIQEMANSRPDRPNVRYVMAILDRWKRDGFMCGNRRKNDERHVSGNGRRAKSHSGNRGEPPSVAGAKAQRFKQLQAERKRQRATNATAAL